MAQTINTDVPAYMVDGTLTDGEAWVALQTVVIEGSSTGTVTMQSTTGANDWSQYQDLVMISYGRNGDGSASVMKMNFNNDTGSNYTWQRLYTNGAAISADSGTQSYLDFFWYPPSATAANVVACSIATLFDINSGKEKSAQVQVANDMDGSGYVALLNCAWKNQSSITEIDLVDYSGANIAAGSRFDLFGVLPRMVTA
tara:strand:- start:1305 stop:1901 length:597 start_codon:yes stop_codon:yes gene_type:complete